MQLTPLTVLKTCVSVRYPKLNNFQNMKTFSWKFESCIYFSVYIASRENVTAAIINFLNHVKI